jgi:hypothetical protein
MSRKSADPDATLISSFISQNLEDASSSLSLATGHLEHGRFDEAARRCLRASDLIDEAATDIEAYEIGPRRKVRLRRDTELLRDRLWHLTKRLSQESRRLPSVSNLLQRFVVRSQPEPQAATGG